MVFLSTLFIVMIVVIAWWLTARLDRRDEAKWAKNRETREESIVAEGNTNYFPRSKKESEGEER